MLGAAILWFGWFGFYGGGVQQLIAQTAAVVVTLALSGGMTLVIGRAINRTIGFRVSHEAETVGVDLAEHAESAYSFGELGSRFNPSGHLAAAQPAAPEASTQRAKEDSFA